MLEINPSHPLVVALAAQVGHATRRRSPTLSGSCFDEARLLDGEKPVNAADFAARLTRVLTKAVAEPGPDAAA